MHLYAYRSLYLHEADSPQTTLPLCQRLAVRGLCRPWIFAPLRSFHGATGHGPPSMAILDGSCIASMQGSFNRLLPLGHLPKQNKAD